MLPRVASTLDNTKQLELRLNLISVKLDGFLQKISELRILGEIMSAEFDRLATEVAETKTVITSAVVAFIGLANQIRDAAGDRAKSVSLADELDAKTNELAAAISANTTPTP